MTTQSIRSTLIHLILMMLPIVVFWIFPIPHPFEELAKYLPVHALLEIFSIFVCGLIFAVAWNAYADLRPGNIIILACALLSAGIIDIAHTLSYAGMPDFVTPSGPEKAINFWLASRLIIALAFIVVALNPWRHFRSKYSRYIFLTSSIVISVIVYWLGLYQVDSLPRTFIEGQGLTTYKIISEYVIMALFLITSILFYRQSQTHNTFGIHYLFYAAILSVLAELCFTAYSSVSDIYNLLGHLYKVVSFIYLYLAIFVVSIHEPFRRAVHAEKIAKSRQNELQKLSTAIEFSPNGTIITDLDGVIEYVNPKFVDVTGYSAEEAIGMKPNLYKSGHTSQQTYEVLWETILSGKEWRGELHNSRKNGEDYWARESISPIINSKGKITHFVGIQEDITESRAIAEKLSFQASHDALTGLINRSEFENRLNRVVDTAIKNGSEHALCFLDLDQFKIINDTCGHIAGDELLRQLGALLTDHLRQRDTLARLGGDEFAILLEHCDLNHAEITANEIRELIEQFQFLWEEHVFSIGVSIGISNINQNIVTSTEALKRADSACYAAKNLGRNRVHVYRSDDVQLAKQEGEFRWVNEIKEALSQDRFKLYAQAIVPLMKSSNRRIYEVLLRLELENGDIVPPGSFLPAAERYNLSRRIDRWVIDHTFMWLHEHLPQLDDLDHLAINLSGPSLGDDALLGHIIKQLQVHQLPSDKIKFEITETAAIANLRDAQIFIKTLREYGCLFALDDFGSGLSSFAYLKNLPVDALKIDGIFVRDILEDPIDEAMVKSINDIGHVIGMKTIAEFVENEAIKQKLEKMGVDYAQGYGIGKPEPINTILENKS